MNMGIREIVRGNSRAPCLPARGVATLLLVLYLLPVVAAAQASAPSPTTPLDHIVVVINDDVITDSELGARITEVKRQLVEQKIPAPSEAVLRKQVLERMVLERIQLQRANQLGIKPTDREVDKAIKGVAERNHLTTDELFRALRQLGVEPEAYRSEVRDQVTIEKLLEREINSKVTVTDEEVGEFLSSRQKQARVDDAFNVSHIQIGVPESANPEQVEEARRKVEEIRNSLLAGANFEEAALVYSQGQNALQGGALGWKKAGQLPSLFLDALEKMQPGEISEIIRSPVGFHILKLNDRQSGKSAQSVKQTHVRQIVMRPSEVQSVADIKTKLAALRERIVLGDDFAELARAYSEDAASAVHGGDIGWVSPGQTVPEFEKEMDELKDGEISPPVESSFGVHLIQVLGRRVEDVSKERDRDTARQQIHVRKADEQFEQWLRRLRDEAYVEYKEESKEGS
jgi:peptidyl-prolyl cis-trans isomerase SurA